MDASADSEAAAGDGGSTYSSGIYTGTIEGFMFPDGSNTVTLNLVFATDGTVTGTANFGTAAMLAPPTDPDATYPPGYGEAFPLTLFGFTHTDPPLEGFTFTVLNGTLAGSELQLQVQVSELWTQWCALQTTVYPTYNGTSAMGQDGDAGSIVGDGGTCGDFRGYACTPFGSSSNPTGDGPSCQVGTCYQASPLTFDCGKLDLCWSGTAECACTSTGCTVAPVDRFGRVTFDLQLGDDAGTTTASGTVTGVTYSSSQTMSVYFTETQ